MSMQYFVSCCAYFWEPRSTLVSLTTLPICSAIKFQFFLAFKWKPCVSFIYKIKQKNLQIKMTQGRDGGGPMILRRSWFLTG